ncbi:MAG: hypothetical protein ACE5IC_09690 [Candidatus Brocadiales bacterium]
MPFSNTWSALQSNLAVGMTIPDWTAARGLLDDSFSIASVTSTHVEIDTPGAQNIQRVPRDDFEVVYNLWQDYCRGAVPRHQIRDLTRFSKYIISIFHWLEGQLGGQLL